MTLTASHPNNRRIRAPFVVRRADEHPWDAMQRYRRETGHVGPVVVTDRRRA